MLTNRFKLAKVMSKPYLFLKFGLMCALFSFAYNFTRWIARKLNLLLSKDLEVFIASLLSAFTLFIADKSDLGLLKIAIYPRAIEACYSLLLERGIVKPIKHGSIIVAAVPMVISTYMYIYEPHNVGMGLVKNLDRYSDVTLGERRMFHASREVVKDMIRNSYPNHRLGK